MTKRLLFTTLALLFSATSLFAAQYSVDVAHSQVHFSVAHLSVFKTRGNFTAFSGKVDIDEANKTLRSAEASISVKSIDTRNEKRDKHLRSKDFFHVKEYPAISFVSKEVKGNGSDITVVGDLTIRGVTKEVILTGAYAGAVTGPGGKKRAGFTATGKIDRKDFGLTWNKALETGGVVVGDEVTIGLEIEAIAD